jgi:hypothetical protein
MYANHWIEFSKEDPGLFASLVAVLSRHVKIKYPKGCATRCFFQAAPRRATISRLIFSIDDPTCVNGRSHGDQVRAFDSTSNCVTPGLLLTEPEQTSNSSSPILTLSQAWPDIPPGQYIPSTTLAGNLQRRANTGLVSMPSPSYIFFSARACCSQYPIPLSNALEGVSHVLSRE